MSIAVSQQPLAGLEPRLRSLLPADLYVEAWLDPSAANLERVFKHLRTLQRVLHDYLPPHLANKPPAPGTVEYAWQEGTLMFTDLAGFTTLMEANAARGQDGALAILKVLNDYFADMIEIVSKSGGELMEFTGDAILALFPHSEFQNETAQAVRAGLRIQRSMKRYDRADAPDGYSLKMRIGIHTGRFLTASLGTPRRMEHVLLGQEVRIAKRAEGAGRVGRVCLTQSAYERVQSEFRFEPGAAGYHLPVDDLTDENLGTFEIAMPRRRAGGAVLLDRSIEGLVGDIEHVLADVEPLAAFMPNPILALVVEFGGPPPDSARPAQPGGNVRRPAGAAGGGRWCERGGDRRGRRHVLADLRADQRGGRVRMGACSRRQPTIWPARRC